MSNIFKRFLTEDNATEINALNAQLSAIDRVMGVIEFTPDGTITAVNDNFLKVVGYPRNAVVGQHHRMFVESEYASSSDYENFWLNLAAGDFNQGQFQRVGKDGKEIWLEASYNPIYNNAGKVIKVIKYATDITEQKLQTMEAANQLAAIDKSQGTIEFDLEGNVLAVNDNFLAVLGYDRSVVVGQHHRKFVKPELANNEEYRDFWAKLARGEHISGTFERVGKNGKQIWLEASYNPMFDLNGNPYKVIKFASDVTEKATLASDAKGQLDAINKALGVIEFDLKGNIIKVNENFAAVTDYSVKEIVGNHHSMFVDATYKASNEYKQFWEKLESGKADSGKYQRVGKGGKEIWLEASYNPIFDSTGKPYKVVKYATDITDQVIADQESKEQAVEALRIKNTLDSASTNMMMADNDGVIRYMNTAAATLMKESVPEFKKVLPSFDANNIIGQDFDVFHKNPAHQRNLLANLNEPYETTIPVASLFMKLKASPIKDESGERVGTSLEWNDVTAERKVEQEISDIVQKASEGDLTARLSLDGKTGATETIYKGINSLIEKMNDVLITIREAGEAINSAASEISTGNNDLSQRTEQQASDLEQTASSMEELSSTVKQNAENAKQANQLASAASGVAVKGGKVVGEVVTTMSDINDSAQKIEDIITVIDGIAFQTNILALNAAVEAARAGEQGRGFAVVAGEVRNLAQRSASAAKEIKELITDSVTKTAEGTRLVENAGSTMDEIVSSVARVTDIMGEISAASSEQSTGIDQVNNAVTSMDETTQQNAALVEEAAAAAESLVDQAVSLMETVGDFKIKGMNNQVERRAPSSPMRPAQSSTPAPVKTSSSERVVAKTGTDDSDEWEEF